MDQNEYGVHNSDDIDEGYTVLPEYCKNAILAAWDGCHKIYLAMDEEKADFCAIFHHLGNASHMHHVHRQATA